MVLLIILGETQLDGTILSLAPGQVNGRTRQGNARRLRALKKLFPLADVPEGHAHRLRDTFAVELFLEGVPLERVAVLPGLQSVKVTDKV